jgi:hypothetical protein
VRIVAAGELAAMQTASDSLGATDICFTSPTAPTIVTR